MADSWNKRTTAGGSRPGMRRPEGPGGPGTHDVMADS
jgi:hypothetical protein